MFYGLPCKAIACNNCFKFHLFTFLINNAKYLVVLFDPFYGPHTTDRMQPLDVAVYGPIKKYFEQELNTFQKTHPGRIVNQYNMANYLEERMPKVRRFRMQLMGLKNRESGLMIQMFLEKKITLLEL